LDDASSNAYSSAIVAVAIAPLGTEIDASQSARLGCF